MTVLWELQRLTFRIFAGLLKLIGMTARGAVQASRSSAARAHTNRLQVNAASGVLAPGDPPAPPGYDVLDYRGLAVPRQVALGNDGLPLGRIVDIKRGPQAAVALPAPAIMRHACVIGPPGSGKTHSIIVPWTVALLAAGCSVVTIDVKGDLMSEIKDHLAALGRPTGAQGLVWDYGAQATHRWNFLSEIGSERGIDAAVLSLLGRQKENDSQPHFYQRDFGGSKDWSG